MPPPRKRPHPRSLDALFGPKKPKVEPKRHCPRGHLQSVKWRYGDECWPCERARRADAEAKISAERSAADRAAYRAENGPPPMVLTMTTWDTKRVVRLMIPPRLAAQKKAQNKRRGRRRGARI